MKLPEKPVLRLVLDTNILISALAIAGNADYLVSGDKSDLLQLGIIEDILIITPRQALDIIFQVRALEQATTVNC